MLASSKILKSSSFVISEVAIFSLSAFAVLLIPQGVALILIFFVIASFATYIIVEQQRKIASLQSELEYHRAKEDEYILRTEQLRRALHDIRSPMSALRLRLQMLQKSNVEPDKKHLARLEESLDTAVEQVLMMSDIQKGKVKPTETLQMHVDQLRAHMKK